MYQCIKCKNTMKSTAFSYDAYDNDIYRRCPDCGGKAEKEKARCALCGTALFSGETAIEAGENIYCTECAVPVAV